MPISRTPEGYTKPESMGILKKITDEYFDGGVREEDKFITNIKDMKEVDLGDDFPVVFADRDLFVNNFDTFSFDEMKEIYGNIKEAGWDMPDYYTFDRMFYSSTGPWEAKDTIISKFKPYSYAKITGKKTKQTLVFNVENKYGHEYWCAPEESLLKSSNERGFNVGSTGFPVCVKKNNYDRKEHLRIRLVKYKDKK